jgi:hypothetical protein
MEGSIKREPGFELCFLALVTGKHRKIDGKIHHAMKMDITLQ